MFSDCFGHAIRILCMFIFEFSVSHKIWCMSFKKTLNVWACPYCKLRHIQKYFNIKVT